MSDSTHTVEGVIADPVLIRHLRIGPCRQLADRIDEGLGRAFGEAQTRIDGNPGFTHSQLAGVLKDVRVHPQPRARINEHHAGEAVRIIDGRGQGDPTAERMSGDHKPVPAQMIGQPNGIIGVIRHTTKPAAGRLAVPRQVYRHRRMTVGHRPHMPVPHPAVTAGTVDVEDALPWGTVSSGMVMYPQSVNISISHAFSSVGGLLGYAETPVSAVSPAASMPATAHSSSISEVSPDIPTAPIMD